MFRQLLSRPQSVYSSSENVHGVDMGVVVSPPHFRSRMREGGESSGDMMVWGGHGSGRIPSSLPVPFPVGVNVKHRCSGFRDVLMGCFRGTFHPFTDSRFTDSRFTDSRKMDCVFFSVCHVIRNFGSRGNVNHGGVSGRRISAAFSVLSLHGPVLSGNTHPRWFIPPAVRLPD